jgi:prolyl-tRNA synthetase
LPEQNDYANKIKNELKNIRVFVDDSDARSADKMWKWIKKGAPLRIEIGAKEAESNTVTITRRDIGKESKATFKIEDLGFKISELLEQMQSNLLQRSRDLNARLTHNVADLAELQKSLEDGVIGFFRLKYAATQNSEFDGLMEKYKISRRCLDEADPDFVFVARSY